MGSLAQQLLHQPLLEQTNEPEHSSSMQKQIKIKTLQMQRQQSPQVLVVVLTQVQVNQSPKIKTVICTTTSGQIVEDVCWCFEVGLAVCKAAAKPIRFWVLAFLNDGRTYSLC